MRSTAVRAILSAPLEALPPQIPIGRYGRVLEVGTDTYAVMMGETLIGTFEKGEVASRDVLIAIVLQNVGEAVSWSEIAAAFRVGRATVGRAMQRLRAGGLPAVVNTPYCGGRTKRTPQMRRRLFDLFDRGFTIRAAHRVVSKRLSYGTVQSMHKEWQRARALQAVPSPVPGDSNPKGSESVPEAPAANDNATAQDGSAAGQIGDPCDVASSPMLPEHAVSNSNTAITPPTPARQATRQRERAPEELVEEGRSTHVQHVGSWILLALLGVLGIYQEAGKWSGRGSRVSLRVALDAFAVSLANGEGSVEGIRRLATPSMALLLRHAVGVGPVWVRQVLARFAAEAATMFRARFTTTLLRRSAVDRECVWLYVDNHLRRYTGKHTVRKGWRMQDKRAVSGTPDYYVHDGDGYPLWRVTSTAHESLSAWLPRVLKFARVVLGEDVEIVLSFDRGGSFPETLAELRDLEGSFVTYEKKPYATLPKSAFTEELQIVLPSCPKRPHVYRYTEAPNKNLREGRGRVRRVALLTEDGTQINIVTSSELPADELIRGHLARWGRQENQFKHGAERWGINQLDGRMVRPYPPDAMVPNPARRQLDRKIQLARAAEGRARCELAELAHDDPERARVVNEIDDLVARREELAALRPQMPQRAPVNQTPLAGKLMRHTHEYKDVLDTLRIAFANVEADLATTLAPHLERPREAKKVVANLFAAPGDVTLRATRWSVRLMPAGTADERRALAALLRELNGQNLVLPGDPTRRRLHFSLAGSSCR